MSKHMTVVFDDDELYVTLKIEAARSGRHAKDIVAEASREWLEAKEDEALAPELDTARAEWGAQGGAEAGEFFRQLQSGSQR